jgi:predicted nucleic-acid-binding Zn-ribbon protein
MVNENVYSQSGRKCSFKEAYFSIVDEQINRFMADKKVLDLKVNTYTTHRHSNAGYDEVRALYTVIYEEQEE